MKGLDNLGNTCYFNTAIQCLLQIPVLSNYFIVNEYKGDSEFVKEYEKVVKTYWTSSKNISNLEKLLKIFQDNFKTFQNNNQHDCHEAMLGIIDLLPKECQEIFEGKVVQETIYPDGKSYKEDVFSLLSMFPSPSGKLEETFSNFSKWDVLSDYIDDKGKKYNCATTRTIIKKLPPIFVIYFPMYLSKVRMSIPDSLILDGKKYSTFALCTHQGSVNSGHYIAFTKHKNQWYIKNDGLCQKIDHFPSNDFHYIVMFKQIIDETH